MKKILLFQGILYFFFAPMVQAATSADYYQAGLTLYNAKNYAQSVQYFSVALQLDPTNTGALQGRANCEYAQGNYAAALADYQKVLAQNPNNAQLSQFVQDLQAKMGSAPASPAGPGASTEIGRAHV